MFTIDKIIRDPEKYSIRIDPDQEMNPNTWNPPIKWEGYINQKKVSFIQLYKAAISRDDFDFTELPSEFNEIISEIVTFINRVTRTMD